MHQTVQGVGERTCRWRQFLYRQKRKTFTIDFTFLDSKRYENFSGPEREVFAILYWKHPKSVSLKAPNSLWDNEQTNGEVKLIDSQATP